MIFTEKIQDKLKGSQLRMVGDPLMRFTNDALSIGAPGSQTHIPVVYFENGSSFCTVQKPTAP